MTLIPMPILSAPFAEIPGVDVEEDFAEEVLVKPKREEAVGDSEPGASVVVPAIRAVAAVDFATWAGAVVEATPAALVDEDGGAA